MAIRKRAGLRTPGAGLRVRPMGQCIEDRQAHAEAQPRRGRAHRRDQGAGEPRAIGERRPAPAPAALPRAEEFVEQVAVAVFHVDEVEASRLRERGRPGERLDQRIDLVIREHRSVVGDADTAIEQRMPLRDARAPAARLGDRPAAAVRELETDDGRRVAGAAGLVEQRRPQARQRRRGPLVENQLLRIRPALGHHRDGFAAPDPAGSRRAEASPTALGERRRQPVARCVPAFHRLHDEAIRGDQGTLRTGAERERLGERRGGAGLDRIVAGEVEPQRREAFAQRGCGAERGHARDAIDTHLRPGGWEPPSFPSSARTPRSHATSAASFCSTGSGSNDRNSIVSGPA